jgi:hypothetical protein
MFWEIVIGSAVIFGVIGLILGMVGAFQDGENPIAGAAAGVAGGALVGLQQGCGCGVMVALALLAVAVYKAIFG